MTFLAGSTRPPGMLSSTSPTEATSSRSSSRSRTTIGYSLPASRKNAAWVPATLVRIVSATPVTVMPSIAALSRSTRTASSGRPSSRPSRESAIPGVVSRIDFRSRASRADSSRSWPRTSTERRLPSPPPPPGMRICWPPEARARMITPGQAGEPAAQVHGDLLAGPLRSSLGTSRTVMLPRLVELVAEAAATAATAAGLGDAASSPPGVVSRIGLLEADQRRLGDFEAGADGQLGVDGHLALVGGRLELEADPRQQHQRGDEGRDADREHGRPVVQRQVQQAGVGVVDAVEHPLAERGTARR